jgi:glutamyl-tRNA reductase
VLKCFGVDYKQVPLATLDQLAKFEPTEFYRILSETSTVNGSILLKTCNRIEFYLDTKDDTITHIEPLLKHWSLQSKFKQAQLDHIIRRRNTDETVEHLVRLGSGLESMLIGEPQILGQLKNALVEAERENATSPLLVELFEKSIRAASKIREQTGINRGNVTVGSAAVKLAEEILGNIQNQHILLIGTGQVARLVLKALRARDATHVTVAGRNYEHAKSFCQTYGGTPILFNEFPKYLQSSNLIIVATSANHHLLTEKDFPTRDNTKKIVVLDLSNPRNVASNVQHVPGVTLQTLENLNGIAEATLEKRRQIVKDAEPLVKEKTQEIISLLKREEAEPIVSTMFHRAEEIRTEVLGKTLARLSLDPDEKKILENMTLSLVEKILDKPAGNIRKAAQKGDDHILLAASNIMS